MEKEPKSPRERAGDLITLLVSDWRPSPRQVLWAIRIGIVLSILVAIGSLLDTHTASRSGTGASSWSCQRQSQRAAFSSIDSNRNVR